MIHSDNGYKEINRQDIEIGQAIYTLRYQTYIYGRNFRYPLVEKHTVTKISPKRTKITTNNGELTKDCKIYDLNEKLLHDYDIARRYYFACKNAKTITTDSMAELSDDDIIAISEHIKEIMSIMNKK